MSTDTLYDSGNRYTHLSTAGTTVISSLETRLTRVNVNNFATGGIVDIYDGVTAVAVQRIASIGAAAAAQAGTYEFNVALSGGLTVVVTNTPDVTVIYR